MHAEPPETKRPCASVRETANGGRDAADEPWQSKTVLPLFPPSSSFPVYRLLIELISSRPAENAKPAFPVETRPIGLHLAALTAQTAGRCGRCDDGGQEGAGWTDSSVVGDGIQEAILDVKEAERGSRSLRNSHPVRWNSLSPSHMSSLEVDTVL